MAATQKWSSRFGFLMASIGFAVGLGNIWRFPYVTGENGGSAFVLVYLLCVAAIGIPILMAEIMLGRRGRLAPPATFAKLASAAGQSHRWVAVGYLNLLTAFAILIGYGVVAGWVLYYLVHAAATGFAGVDAVASERVFVTLTASTPLMMFWTLVAFGIAGVIVARGVSSGIEKAVVVLMPLLFVLLVSLALFNAFAGGMPQALDYLFTLDFSKITGAVVLAAVGQAFFSIGVAMAGMMMFGAYLDKDISIAGSAFLIVIADTGVALTAGLVIFPMVFEYGLDPAGGAGLIFETLPVAFAQMPGGAIIAPLFFLLLSVAAVTSIVGLVEPVTAWVAERFGLVRSRATVVLLSTLLPLSLVSALSYNHWANVRMFGMNLAAVIDFVPNQIMLPLGGLAIALFTGWFFKREAGAQELGLNEGAFSLWYQLLRFVVVPALLLIFIGGLS